MEDSKNTDDSEDSGTEPPPETTVSAWLKGGKYTKTLDNSLDILSWNVAGWFRCLADSPRRKYDIIALQETWTDVPLILNGYHAFEWAALLIGPPLPRVR